MPIYQNSGFQNPILALKGIPVYLWGKYDYKYGNTNAFVQDVAIASNVATVTLTILNGPLPYVGSFISIVGTTTGTGEFNVNRAVITAVDINAATGVGTVTFALTGADIGTTADSGSIIIEPCEIAEAAANGNSIACAYQMPDDDSQMTVPMAVTFPSIPAAATATLQRAMKNATAIPEWTNTTAIVTVAASAYTAGPVVLATLERGYIYRIALTGITGGTNPSVIGKLG